MEAIYLGAWFNGRTSVSKTVGAGSIPAAPAITTVEWFFLL